MNFNYPHKGYISNILSKSYTDSGVDIHTLERKFAKLVITALAKYGRKPISEIVEEIKGSKPRQNTVVREYFRYCQSVFSYIDYRSLNKRATIQSIFSEYFKNKELSNKEVEFIINLIVRYACEEVTYEDLHQTVETVRVINIEQFYINPDGADTD